MNNPGRKQPKVAVSTTTTLDNKTGSWKYIRPMYQDKVAPCNARCPIGIDIEGYMSLLGEDRESEACDLLLQENPIPAVTGRVCDHPCERACNRSQLDAPVAIHAVERMVGDHILEKLPKPRKSTRSQRIAVVGSGPAGLGCAYHLVLLGYRVTVVEAADQAGGMLRLGIPEFRLPRDVLDRQIEWLERFGIEFRLGTRVGDQMKWEDLAEFDAVFMATGAHRGRDIGIPDETGQGFLSGLEFLKVVNRGERPVIGRQVVVVGGGNTAIDCARTALRLGADPLILYRRTRHEMPAIEQEIAEAESEGVRFQFLAAPVGTVRGENGLEAIECVRMKLGPEDASGRRRPVPMEGENFTVPAETVIKAIGETAEFGFLPEEVAAQGSSVVVDEIGRTSKYWVFAGGDVTNQSRTVAFALGAGKRAALGIDRQLRAQEGEENTIPLDELRFAEGNVSMARWRRNDPISRAEPVNRTIAPEEINLNHFESRSRHHDRELPIEQSVASFDEVNRGLSHENATEEARRCFNCGVCNGCELCLILCPDVAITRGDSNERFIINMDYCKGCGICAGECPRGAMAMTREGL